MKKLWKLLVLSAILTLSAVLFGGCGSSRSSELNLTNYFYVEFDGYDGSGTAKVKVDDDALWATLVTTLADSKVISSPNEMALITEAYQNTDLANLLDDLESKELYSLDKSENLSNGDEITLSFHYNNDNYKESKIRLAGDSVKITVAGLPEIETFDAFEGMSMNFFGTAPFGTAELGNATHISGPTYRLDGFTYTLDKYDHLRNGDVVTVSVEATSSGETGRVPAATEKQFTVEGLSEYVSSLDQIPDEIWNKIRTEMEDQKTANLDYAPANEGVSFEGVTDFGIQSAGNIEEISNFTWDKAILLTLKDGVDKGYSYNDYSILYIVYSCDISAVEGTWWNSQAASDMTGAFYLEDLVINPDGSILIPAGDIWMTNAVKGEDTFRSDFVLKNQDRYYVSEMDLNWN